MRAAVYGGSFNPPTIAHKAAITHLCGEYDVVYVLPAYISGYKHVAQVAPFDKRMDMLMNLELPSNAKVLKFEKDFYDRTVGATYPMLGIIATQFGIKAGDMDLIIGADQLEHLDSWVSWKSLVREYPIRYFLREGYSVANHPWLVNTPLPTRIDFDLPDVSSTIVRNMIINRRILDLPSAVPAEIIPKVRNLYK